MKSRQLYYLSVKQVRLGVGGPQHVFNAGLWRVIMKVG